MEISFGMTRVISLVLLVVAGAACAGKLSSVGVTGRLMCGNKPLAGAKVTIVDTKGFDSELGSVKTDKNGDFKVSGTTSHLIRGAKTEVRIFHSCNNKLFWGVGSPCKRKHVYKIPSSYVATGAAVSNWYNMQTMNMEAKQTGETSKCWPFGNK